MSKNKHTKLGINRKPPTPTILVLTGVAITTTMALTIQLLTVTTTTLLTATTTSLSVPHSNTIFRLYILRNIYSKILDIKGVYPFLI